LIFCLGVHFLLSQLNKSYNKKTIPMAGFQSVFLLFFLSIHTLVNTNTVTDDLIIKLIHG
jgi:hypothetical protein